MIKENIVVYIVLAMLACGIGMVGHRTEIMKGSIDNIHDRSLAMDEVLYMGSVTNMNHVQFGDIGYLANTLDDHALGMSRLQEMVNIQTVYINMAIRQEMGARKYKKFNAEFNEVIRKAREQ